MIPFRVQFRAGASLFEQVVYAATKAMISGQMRPGDAFPSVRVLSRELKINPNTAHKIVAYLVGQGFLETRPGIGTVVAAKRLSIGRDEMLAAIAEHWKRLSTNDAKGAAKAGDEGRKE